MAAPSYTYTLTNGSTADASQVMQDFNDILNGVTDGTKDLTVSALTANGTANLKGQVNLGDATADDIQFNGSLATTVNIKTDSTYDIGTSSKGIRTLYLGANSQRVSVAGAAAMSATWTLTLPVTAGTANYILGETSGGSGATEWKSLAVGTSGTDFAIAHAANSVTFNLPDASAANRGAVTTGTQTIAGTKTFSGQLIGKGTATNDTAAAGYIGEFMEQNSTGNTSATSSTVGDVDGSSTGIALTAGTWDISGILYWSPAAGTSFTIISGWIGTATGTSTTGRDLNRNYNAFSVAATINGGNIIALTLPTFRVTLSGSTTYYLKQVAVFTVSTMTVNGNIRATRIR